MNFLKLIVAGAALVSLSAASASAATFEFRATDDARLVLFGEFTTSGGTEQGYGKSVTGLSATLRPGAVGFSPTGAATLIGNPNADGSRALSPNGSFFFDDLYDGTIGVDQQGTGFDSYGLLFSVGGIEFDLFSNGPGQDYTLQEQSIGGAPGLKDDVNFSTFVPEPATWAMMLIGTGLMGGGLRVRRGRRFVFALST